MAEEEEVESDLGEEEEEEKEEEDAKDDEDEDDDDDFDFDALAERAVRVAEVRRRRAKEKELSLDVGLTADQLYMVPGSDGRGVFNTAVAPGVSRLDPFDFARGAAPEAPAAAAEGSREVRGAPVRPVDDKGMRRREAKKLRESRLEKWYGLRRRVLTPELEKELKAIKLRANFDPKRFYKANDSKALPKYFAIATEVGGGLAPAGERASKEVTAHSGRSFLSEVLRNEKAQEWTRKRLGEVHQRGQASFRSGHGQARPKKDKAKGKHRGGSWKKQRKG